MQKKQSKFIRNILEMLEDIYKQIKQTYNHNGRKIILASKISTSKKSSSAKFIIMK